MAEPTCQSWTLLLTFLPLWSGGGAWFLYYQKEPLLAIICVGLGLVYLLGVACALGFYARRLTTRDFQTLVQSRNLTPQGRQKRTTECGDRQLRSATGLHRHATRGPFDRGHPRKSEGEDSARLRRLEGQGRC